VPAGSTSPAPGCDGNKLVLEALSRQGRYQDVRDNLRVKEVRLDSAPGVRWVICHNPVEAAKDKAERDRQLAAVTAELDRITKMRTAANSAKGAAGKNTTGSKKTGTVETAAHVKAECALRDHKALGKWVKQTPSGGLVVDRAKIVAEERLDGKVPAGHLRPVPSRWRGRLGVQEPARGRTLLPGHEVHPGVAAGVPPSRTAHPRTRADVLACAAARARRRAPHRPDLDHDQPAALPGPLGDPDRHRRHRRAHHPADQRPSGHSWRLRLSQPPAVTALDPC